MVISMLKKNSADGDAVNISPEFQAAVSENWRRTLDQIPTVIGRLAFLSSLRSVATGTYEHFGLSQRMGPEPTNDLLRRIHLEVFENWLCFGLERQKEEIEDDVLEEVAKVLKVPVDAIKNLDDTFSFTNNFHDNSINHGPLNNYNCNFNPIDKIVQLYEEKIALYERMLKEKDEMMARLEKLIVK